MKRREKGFTTLELLIATAITGMIFGVLGLVMHQVVTVPESGNDRLTALHELQNAAHWFNRDGQTAVTATGGSSLALTLSDNSSITYTRQGNKLMRQTATANMTLAQHIDALSFSVDDRYVTMEIRSSPGGRWDISENATYLTCLRPDEA